MKIKTATEFLIEEMQKRIPPFYAHYVIDMGSLYEQAKDMERENIINAYEHGSSDEYDLHFTKDGPTRDEIKGDLYFKNYYE